MRNSSTRTSLSSTTKDLIKYSLSGNFLLFKQLGSFIYMINNSINWPCPKVQLISMWFPKALLISHGYIFNLKVLGHFHQKLNPDAFQIYPILKNSIQFCLVANSCSLFVLPPRSPSNFSPLENRCEKLVSIFPKLACNLITLKAGRLRKPCGSEVQSPGSAPRTEGLWMVHLLLLGFPICKIKIGQIDS